MKSILWFSFYSVVSESIAENDFFFSFCFVLFLFFLFCRSFRNHRQQLECVCGNSTWIRLASDHSHAIDGIGIWRVRCLNAPDTQTLADSMAFTVNNGSTCVLSFFFLFATTECNKPLHYGRLRSLRFVVIKIAMSDGDECMRAPQTVDHFTCCSFFF